MYIYKLYIYIKFAIFQALEFIGSGHCSIFIYLPILVISYYSYKFLWFEFRKNMKQCVFSSRSAVRKIVRIIFRSWMILTVLPGNMQGPGAAEVLEDKKQQGNQPQSTQSNQDHPPFAGRLSSSAISV